MIKFIYFLLIFSNILLTAQVGINTDTPEPSSVLEIKSTDKGILIPRVALTSLTDEITIANPAHSLLVFATGGSLPEGYYFWDDNSSNWVKFSTSQQFISTQKRGTFTIGDVDAGTTGSIAVSGDILSAMKTNPGNSSEIIVTFNTPMPNATYDVLVTLEVISGALSNNINIKQWAIGNKTTNGFTFIISETANNAQNLLARVRIID